MNKKYTRAFNDFFGADDNTIGFKYGFRCEDQSLGFLVAFVNDDIPVSQYGKYYIDEPFNGIKPIIIPVGTLYEGVALADLITMFFAIAADIENNYKQMELSPQVVSEAMYNIICESHLPLNKIGNRIKQNETILNDCYTISEIIGTLTYLLINTNLVHDTTSFMGVIRKMPVTLH